MQRSATVAILLLATLVMISLVAWEAIEAQRSHARVARRVVGDFASIASDELLRRASVDISGYGALAVAQAMIQRLNERWSLPVLEAGSNERLALALPLVRHAFIIDLNSGTYEPRDLPAPLAKWLVANLLEETVRRARDGEQIFRIVIEGEEHIVFSGVSFLESRRLFGFTIDESQVGPFLARAFERRSVFPPSLGDGTLTNEDAFIEVSRGGLVQFRSGGDYDPAVGVTRVLGSQYGPIFEGATVRSSIRPRAAPLLVIGGLPRSRLPMLGIVLLTTVGLLGAAIYLLHGERQLARLRSDFVTGVSHELRTPLTQIRMFAETLLLDRVRSGGERRRYLEIIDMEARRLAHLVDNVLVFSRGERHALEIAPTEVDAASLIAQTTEQLRTLLSSEDVRLDVSASRPLHVRVDPDGFKQVLLNLLENAVKYGRRGQTVSVIARRTPELFRIEVEDQGPGVPARDRDRIWQRFFRLERDRGTHKAGTGIGLAVVREIVSLHGGRAWVEDGTVHGSRFVVEIPQ